jgi:hypothetical protein
LERVLFERRRSSEGGELKEGSAKKGNEEDYNPAVKRGAILRKISNHRRHINPLPYPKRLHLLLVVSSRWSSRIGTEDGNSLFQRHTMRGSGSIKLNSVALVRERTMPTERPPLIGEVVRTFADRGCRVVSATDTPGR